MKDKYKQIKYIKNGKIDQNSRT